MRILIALLVLVATPAQAATITYLTDHRGVGSRWEYWSGSNDGPQNSFYWEPCEQFAPDCAANAGGWNGSVDHVTHLRPQAVYGDGVSHTDAHACSYESCYHSMVMGSVRITFTVDEDSDYVYMSVIDRVAAPIVRGVLRAGEVFTVGGEMETASWPNENYGSTVRDSSFAFSFYLTSVPEPGTAALVALGLAVTAARRRRYPLPSQ